MEEEEEEEEETQIQIQEATAETFKKVSLNKNDFAEKSTPPIEEKVYDVEQIDHDAVMQAMHDVAASPIFMAFDPKEGSPSVRDSRFLVAVG